jgi:hypothetical protein
MVTGPLPEELALEDVDELDELEVLEELALLDEELDELLAELDDELELLAVLPPHPANTQRPTATIMCETYFLQNSISQP